MELRVSLLVVIGTVLLCLLPAVVLGRQLKQCSELERCIPIKDCPEFSNYVGQKSSTWPEHVRREAIKQYCEKGNKVCCSTVSQIGDSAFEQPKKGLELLDLKECGKSTADRIAHGKAAEVFQFPWMALLRGLEQKFHCGGTLIAERYVLTAAHCNGQKVLFVRLGETYLNETIDCNPLRKGEKECAEPPQDIPVERFIRHKYSVSKKKNDIALVRLRQPAQLNYNVVPICLPLPEMSKSPLPSKMIVSGWGYTELTMDISNELRYALIPIVDLSRCNETLKRTLTDLSVDQRQVCAGTGDDGADNCHGDSGGPLQYYGTGGYVIHAVVSYGMASCGTEAEPGIYTKVSHYLDWIIQNLT